MMQRGAKACDYGNNLRGEATIGGAAGAFEIPGFVPAYIRPQFCTGRGPFRWVALSGDPADIHVTDQAVLDLFPEDEHLRRWITMAREQVAFQGLPARICWLACHCPISSSAVRLPACPTARRQTPPATR